MGNYINPGALDWRAFEGARASGISFLLADGRCGEITDPHALRAFYTRLFYAKKQSPSTSRRAPTKVE